MSLHVTAKPQVVYGAVLSGLETTKTIEGQVGRHQINKREKKARD